MTDIAIWENEKKVLTMAKEFIERGALIARYDAEHVGPPGRARELMVTAPAADVIEVRHERWEKHGSKWQCTGCKVLMSIDGTPQENLLYYCPNCGTLMDKEVADDKEQPEEAPGE